MVASCCEAAGREMVISRMSDSVLKVLSVRWWEEIASAGVGGSSASGVRDAAREWRRPMLSRRRGKASCESADERERECECD